MLFADLVGSTALGGSQDPERTRAMLDRFYDAMAAEIERVGGTVEKFVGDAVMAAFGAPAALEDHAERALHAALAMQHRLHELFGEELSLRIGVNTGEVVVGQPREGSSFVTGDAVNVGARLEEAAEPGQILAGERTVAAVRGAFEFEDPVTIGAKGKPDGVVSQRLVRALTLMRPRGVGGLRQAFVGRDEELERLRTAYRNVVDGGRPELVTIMGDAGIGKSRLVREFWAWLAEQSPQPLQRTGRCLSYGHGTAYWALAEILREHFDIRDGDPPEAVGERLGAHRHLGRTLGLDVAPGLHPLAARERLHDSWAEFLDELVAERPTVLLVEDVHWGDDDLFDLLDSLVAQVRGPLLLIATARPELVERRPAWNRFVLALEALPPTTADQLLGELVGDDVCGPVREIIIERAEGNPFFVEELISTMIDRGVLTRENGGWACSNLPPGFEVPDTVQAVLAARIDLLPSAEKAALQAASVIGRVFWTGPVYELVGGSPDFGLLEERDFVRRRAGSSIAGEREYAVKHALTREVAYASLPKARRAQLHASFAGWLSQLGDGGDEHAPLLAYHYAQAVQPEDVDLAWPGQDERVAQLREQAVHWSRRAAELAIGAYEIDDGIALLEHALELEPDVDARAELWREIGRAHALAFHGIEFWEAMEHSLELTQSERVRAETLAELSYQTSFRVGMWKKAVDRKLVTARIDEAIGLTEPGSAARLKAICAEMNFSGVPNEAHVREAIETAERLGDPDLTAAVFVVRAIAAARAGRHAEALELARAPIEFVNDIRDPERVVEIYESPIPEATTMGLFGEARRLQALHTAATHGLTAHHRMHSIAIGAEIEELRGDWPAIRSMQGDIERAVEENLDTPCVRNERALLLCACASVAAGDWSEADRLQGKAHALGMEGYDAALSGARIRLALLRSELDTLEELVADALQPERRRLVNFAVSARTMLVEALVRLGDRERVEEHAGELATLSGTYLEPFGLRALGQVRGDRSLIERALARFEEMSLEWYAEETRALL